MPLYRQPPPPPNQRRRLVISTEAITGTGAADQTAQSASGAGLEAIGGSGAGTAAAATATGSGTSLQTFTGTGAGTQAIALAAGVGVELITGSGDSSPPPASSSGSGTTILAITGTGAGTQAAQTTSGGGTGGAVTAGRLSQAPVEVAVAPNSAARLSQGAVEVVVAKADPKARLSTLAVEAIVGREVVGAELAIDAIIEAPIFIPTASTVPVYDPVYSETGYYDLLLDPDVYGEDAGAQAIAVTGVGAGTQVAQSGAGSGVVVVSVVGAGAGDQLPSGGFGTGLVLQPVTGTGAGTQLPQSGLGYGIAVIAVTGTGAGTQAPQGGSGTGLVLQPITGTGAGTQVPQTAVGVGLVAQAVTGTGAGTQAPQSGAGAGLMAIPVTGTGAGTQPAGSGYGAGLALVIPPPEVTTSVIVIRVDGVDITDHIRHSDAMFVSQVNGTAGTCQFAVRDLGHDYSFVFGQTINLEIDGILRWSGFLQTIDRQYTTYVVDTSDPDATARWFLITGSDVNILFSRRVTYDRAHPRRLTALSPPPVYRDAVHADQWEEDTPSDAVVKYFITHYTDMLSDGVGLGGVQNLGSPNPDWAAAYAAAQTVGDFMRSVNSLLGGIWYLTPNKTLVHRAVETATTPKYLSDYDDGNPNRVGVRDYSLVSDATQMVNDAHVWGTAAGVSVVRHSRAQDAASIAAHGRWQGGEFNQSMYKQSSLDNRSEALIYGNDASRHGAKDDKLVAQATVFTTDFYLGDVVTCYSHVYEDGAGHSPPYESADVLTAILPIRRIVTTFPTSTSVRFDLLLTQELDEPWSIYEFKFPKFKPPSGTPIPKGPNIKLPPVVVSGGCTSVICGITDTFDRPNSAIPGESDSGAIWTTSLAAGSIAEISGNRLHLKNGSWGGSFYNPTIAQIQASTMSGRLVYTPVNVSGTPMARIQMTHSSLSFINAAGSTNQIQVTRGSTTTMGSFALTAGTSYNVEWEEDATSSRWRIWAVGSTAPTGWTITGTGAASPAVQVGFILHINTLVQHECYIDNLDLDEVNRCTAPNFDHFNRTASNGWGVASPSGARWRLWPFEPGNVPPSWWVDYGYYADPSKLSVSGGIGRINTAAGGDPLGLAGEPYIYDPILFDKLPLTIQFDVNADVEVDFFSGDGWPGTGVHPYTYITIGTYQPWRDGIYASVPGAGFDEEFITDLGYTPGFEEYFDGGGAWPASNPILRCKWEFQERSVRAKWWRIGTPEPDWMHVLVMDEDTPPEITYHGKLLSLAFGWFTGQGLIMYDNLSISYSGSACYPCGPGAGAFYDSFNRSTSNGSLGTSDSGSTWQLVGASSPSAYRCDGTRLFFATGVGLGKTAEYQVIGPGPWAFGSDFTLQAKLEMNVSNIQQRLGLTIGLGAPHESSWLSLSPQAGGGLQLRVSGDTDDDAVNFSSYVYGLALALKWEHTTTVSRAKLWAPSLGAEPTAWDVERSTVGDLYGAGDPVAGDIDSISLYFQGATSGTESGFNVFIDSLAIDPGSGASGGGCADQAMIVVDDFNRSVANNGGGPGATGSTSGTSDPWYTPSSGTAPTTYEVSGGVMKALVTRPSTSTYRAGFLTMNNGGSDYIPYFLAGAGFPEELVNGNEIDYQMDWMVSSLGPSSTFLEVWLSDGYLTDYDGIGAEFFFGTNTIRMDGYTGTSPVMPFTFAANTWYTYRVRAVGGVAMFKIWARDSVVEPANWLMTMACKAPPWPSPGELSISCLAYGPTGGGETVTFSFDNLIRRESSEVTTGETTSGIPLYGEVWETISHSGGSNFATTRAWTGPLQVWVNGAIVTAFTSSPSLGEFHLTSSISSSATLRVRYQANGDPA